LFVESIVIHNRNFPKKDRYPFNLPGLRKTDHLDLRTRVTFFVGENGSGKSTLLEALARRFGLTVWGGEKTHIMHRNPYETRLYNFISLHGSWSSGAIKKGFLFRAENFFNYACYLDDLTMYDPAILEYYGGGSLHQQSHGEAFLSFLENRCSMDGLYLLDEPEAALSPANQLAFLQTLWKMAGKHRTQFIISTHSPIILSYPGAQILSFDFVPIREIPYEETHSYQFYMRFMNDRDSLLKSLKEEKPGMREGHHSQGDL
jgi:predicted ATPase